jgi:hypothetical protein
MTDRPRRHAGREILHRLVSGVGAVLVWLLLLAGPASADAARPGNVRSEVTAIAPDASGVSARVVGGDSFVRVSAAPGVDVLILGYSGEPYLHIAPDGSVEQNERSPARWLNATRFGATTLPSTADAAAAPEWRRVGGGAAVAWHDHRTHWMARTRPDPPERQWSVPIVVDGRRATIEGHYYAVDPPARWPWLVVAAGTAALAWWLGTRRVVGAAALLAAGAVMTGVVGSALARLPAGRNGVVVMALAAVALVAAVAAIVTRRSPFAGAFLAGGGVALVVYAVRRLDVLDHAVLVTSLPGWLDRLSVASSLGVGLGVVAVGMRCILRADLDQVGGYQPPGTSSSASLGPHDPRA